MNLKRIMSFLVFFQGIMGGEICPDADVWIYEVNGTGEFKAFGVTKTIPGKTAGKIVELSHTEGHSISATYLDPNTAAFYDENGAPVGPDFKLPYGLPDLDSIIAASTDPNRFRQGLIDSQVYKPIVSAEGEATTGIYSAEAKVAYFDLLVEDGRDKSELTLLNIKAINLHGIENGLSDLHFVNMLAGHIKDTEDHAQILRYLDHLNSLNRSMATTTPRSICANMLFCGYRTWMSILVWLTIVPALVFIVGLIISFIPWFNPTVQVSR